MTNPTELSNALVHEIGEHGRLTVRVADARVRVRGVDGATVRVVDTSGRDLADAFEIDRAPGELSIRSRDHRFGLVFGLRRGTTLEIEAPRGAALSIESASGDLEATGATGPQRFRTASGQIAVTRGDGSLSIDSVSGDVVVDAAGAVEVKARTVSGDIAIRAPLLRAAALTTTSGDVRLDAPLQADGGYTIQSVSGDAAVRAHDGLRVEGRTMTGSIRSSIAHRSEEEGGQRTLVVGRGGATVSFRSLSGDLRVEPAARRTDDPSPPPPDATGTESTDDAATAAMPGTTGATEAMEASRLDILRALERGEIDVSTAGERLAALEGGDR